LLIVWTCRLLFDAGVLEPASIPDIPLPNDTPEDARIIYQGFRYLLGCRWLYEQVASPLSHRFGVDWCQTSQQAISRGINPTTSFDLAL
jgi:hypothetical protein